MNGRILNEFRVTFIFYFDMTFLLNLETQTFAGM